MSPNGLAHTRIIEGALAVSRCTRDGRPGGVDIAMRGRGYDQWREFIVKLLENDSGL